MNRLRHSGSALRGLLALALLAWMAVRSIAPTGFMPEWSGTRLRIVACPDYALSPPTYAMPGMDHGGSHHSGDQEKTKARESCPYAAATALHALGADGPPLIVDQNPVGIAPQPRQLASIAASSRRDRPPSRAPPTLV